VSGARPEPGEYRIRVHGHSLRVSIRGIGAPVLLINGLGGSLSLWKALYEDLTGFQVISFDAPGTGHSSTPRRAYTIGELACVVAEMLDDIGFQRVDVVGYSFGGQVAQQFAHDHPGRVRRLVLGATMCGWGAIPGEMLALLSMVTPIRYHSSRAYSLTAPYLAGGAAEASQEFIERTAAARVAAPPAWSGYALQLMAAWSWSSLPWLHTLEQPTLVLTGAQDRLLPAVNSELIASRLPHARLLSIDGWGHYVLLDRSSGAGAAIAEFLAAEQAEDAAVWRGARSVSPDEARASWRGHSSLLSAVYWPPKVYRWLYTSNSGHTDAPEQRTTLKGQRREA
jgi:poly(3-hydroxyoctanoate) depolymerase